MKRALTGFLAFLLFFALLPVKQAEATMLSGYTSKVDYDNTDPERYKIEIDITNQVITVLEKDETGAYSRVAMQGLCTTGNEENPTGTGTYKLGHLKERFGYFVAFGQYAQYWTQVVRGIYIHSIMYDSKDITKLSKSAYNGLGKALSHGCVRVLPAHAKWIFYNCPPGTLCVITKSRAADAGLVSALKSAKPSYTDVRHVPDFKADPPILNATAVAAGVQVRTGFSASKDTTVVTLSGGETVKVLQIGPDWCKVQTGNGKLGYVQTQYLNMDIQRLTSTHGSYIATEKTYLYSYPSTSAAKLATYSKDMQVDVIGTLDKYWLTASVGGVQGYVRLRHLQAVAGGSAPVINEEVPQTNPLSSAAFVKEGIIANFRSGPGSSFPILAELPAGTPLTLLQVEGNWYKAVAYGMEGYVSAVCVAFEYMAY